MTTAPAKAPASPAEILAWEEANHMKVAVAAVVAGALSLMGGIVTAVAFGGIPKYEDKVVPIGQALGNLAQGTPIPPGRAVAQLRYIGDNPLPFLVGPLGTALGAALAFFVLAYLFKAARARTPSLSQFPLIAAAIGAAAYAVGTATVGIMRVSEGSSLAADATNRDALDAISTGPVVVGTLIQLMGAFGMGLGFVLISLNAMRGGLLTRFMGVLGMIVGATFILPIDQQQVIRSFWLIAVGFLIARRWPRGLPPAWETGRAVPWPSGAQARRERQAQAAPAEPPATPAPTLPDDGLSQGQRRKKRKKK
ncbi:MAG: hypothetical protein MUC84_03835 [Solirubrobacteraceae bacterium]|jgi:hypothetical protein|nr:hypothetical protein [Solirubrobacteraceae bacterium]